jgi:putative ABC transport system permease protein
MADAYFEGGDARATLAALAAQPDGVLVSEETVRDFQLQPGDRLNLRLQGASDHQYRVVPFRFVGVAREFPTAPKDSFLVANAAYVAEATGAPGAEIVLLATDGDAAAVAARAREVVTSLPGAKVTAIGETQQLIGSSLTAVDLRGLTRLELGFAVLMVAGAVGLVLALDLAERRRGFAILTALGAKERQLGAFLWGEGLLMLVGAAIGGGLIGWAVAATLVAMLTGVFDPPPEALAVPWAYLLAVAVAAALAVAAAVLGTLAAARRSAVEALRDG